MLDNDKLCQACKQRPIWGYIGSGVYISRLCKYCYKRGGNTPEESSGRKTTNGNIQERNTKQ